MISRNEIRELMGAYASQQIQATSDAHGLFAVRYRAADIGMKALEDAIDEYITAFNADNRRAIRLWFGDE